MTPVRPPLPPDWWYPACEARRLRDRPLGVTVLGVPMVLWRDGDRAPRALLDRCPHRNVPLALGRPRDGELECAYHGWRFDGTGRCTAIPGLPDEGAHSAATARAGVPSFPAREANGLIWVVPSGGPPARPDPPDVVTSAGPGAAQVRRRQTLRAPLVAVLENILDVPHTAFAHRGLFRGGRAPVPITVRVVRGPDRVEAVYEGEPRPPALAARLLSPSGGELEHVDRFILPSVTQVDYRLGSARLLVTSACTPVDERTTVLHAVVSFRAPRLTAAVARVVVPPVAERILRQDAKLLRAQRDNIERFGGEAVTSTSLDVMAGQIARLLRQAAEGRRPDVAPPDDAPSGHDEGVTIWV